MKAKSLQPTQDTLEKDSVCQWASSILWSQNKDQNKLTESVAPMLTFLLRATHKYWAFSWCFFSVLAVICPHHHCSGHWTKVLFNSRKSPVKQPADLIRCHCPRLSHHQPDGADSFLYGAVSSSYPWDSSMSMLSLRCYCNLAHPNNALKMT